MATTKKKTTSKKKTVPSKTINKKPAKRLPKKASAIKKPAQRKIPAPVKEVIIEPGPPHSGIPPVEEPAQQEKALGVVTHYYSHLGVAVVQVSQGSVKTGDIIRIKGHSTDFSQPVTSMEYEHGHVETAEAGQTVGLQVTSPVRQHDIVYIIR